jgi:hypothetical protein
MNVTMGRIKFTRGERCVQVDLHGRGFTGRLLIMNKLWTRMALTTALAGGLLLAVGVPVRADGRADCQRRLEADRVRIDNDSHRHGEHSRQVDRDVDRMDADRNWCREHKSDWDHDKFDVGIYFRK